MRFKFINGALALGLSAFYALQASAVTVDFIQTKAWSSGYNADVVITNDSNSAINGWSLSFQLGDKISKISRSSFTGSDPYTVQSVDYSANIAAGKTETFSYTAAGTFDAKQLAGCVFNGKACSFLVAGKPLAGSGVVSSSAPKSSVSPSSTPKPSSSPAPSSKPQSSSSAKSSAAPLASSKASSSAAPSASGLAHPGIMTSLADLERIKGKINSKQEPWLGQFNKMKARVTRTGIKLHNPRIDNNDAGGRELMYCGGYNKGKDGVTKVVACDWPVEDGIDAYTFALLGYFTGDISYSKTAVNYLMSWSDINNFEGFDLAGSNARLQAGWTIPWYANTAEILRYTYSDWKASNTTAVNGLINRLLPLVVKDSEGAANNWLHSRIEAHMAAAVFLDDKTMFDTAIKRWQLNVPSYIYSADDGAEPIMPKTSQAFARGKAQWYTSKFYPGMTMETCRDLNHQGLGMNSIFNGLQIANVQNVDILSGNDIRKRLVAFLNIMPVWSASKQDHPDGICNNPVVSNPPALLRDGAVRYPYPVAYTLLVGSADPLTLAKQDIDKSAAVEAARWVRKWETLIAN